MNRLPVVIRMTTTIDQPARSDAAPSIHSTEAATSPSMELSDVCCPYVDHGRLLQLSATRLQCQSCHREFPIVGTRPILLDESRSLFAATDIAALADERQFPENTGWRYFFRRLFPVALSRDLAIEVLPPRLAELGATPAVLVIGCGTTHGRYQPAFSPPVRLFLTDVTLQGDAALVCDGECLPFRDESIDCVIVDQVLEHALHPLRIVDEICRCLKTGGILFSGVPFHMPVHGFPYDFQRYTPLGHRMLYRRFEELDFQVTQGPVSAFSLTVIALCASLSDNLWWKRATSLMARVVLGPLLRLDRRFTHARDLRIPAASLFVGRKQVSEIAAPEIVRRWTKSL